MAHPFSELHRRHPDVDLVLLPPEPPLPDAPEATDDHVATTWIRVASAARQLWGVLAPGSDVEPTARWSYAADPGRVRAVARVVDHRADGLELLVRLRHELESHGWDVARPPGAVERISALLDDVELTASYAAPSGAFVLTVSSAPLVVGRDRATALAGGR